MSTLRKAIRSIFTRRIPMNTRAAGYEIVCLRAHLLGIGF
jgi:hypothetical protein